MNKNTKYQQACEEHNHLHTPKGLWNCVATLENREVSLYKSLERLGIYPKEMKIYIHAKI